MPLEDKTPRLRFISVEPGITDFCEKLPRFEPVQLSTLLAAVFLIIAALSVPQTAALLLQIAALLLAGWKTALAALSDLKNRRIGASLSILLSVPVLAAVGELTAAGWILVIYRIGLYLIRLLCCRKSRILSGRLCPVPERATLVDARGNRLPALAENLRPGDAVAVKTGERIPLDCRCDSDCGEIDLMPFTGRETVRKTAKGDLIPSGAINRGDTLICTVTATQDESTATRVHDLLYRLPRETAAISGLPLKLLRRLSPLCFLIGLAAAILFPLLHLSDLSGGLVRLAVILTVSSSLLPTAFLPLTILSASAAALERGCVFKTADSIRNLADADLILLDHQAVLADAEPEVVELRPANGVEPDHLLLQAVSLANGWDSPVGKAIRAYGGRLHPLTAQEHTCSEHGASGKIGGHDVYCGDAVFFSKEAVRPALLPDELEDRVFYLARDGVYLGSFLLSGKVPQESLGIARTMHEVGVADTILISNADPAAVKQVSDPCGIINWHARQTPRSAAVLVRALQEQGENCAFVGDWERQAPAMSDASVSISVGLNDSLFQTPPDIMMTHRDLRLLAEVKLLTVETVHRLRLLFWLMLAVRGILILLSLIGLLPAWLPILVEMILAAGCVRYGGRLSDRKIEL